MIIAESHKNCDGALQRRIFGRYKKPLALQHSDRLSPELPKYIHANEIGE
jgi:hypothetical protein